MTFNVLQIICLLSVIATVTISSPVKEKGIRKSRLMFEYDWPKPIKNLKRFPHSDSCSHFYHTKADGSHVIKKCPEGELFDYRSLRCKEKAFAKCWKDLVKKITSNKRQKIHFSCPFPWGLYPDTGDCSKFHECLGGKPYTRKCPFSTLFDQVERTCVHENEATCADESDAVERDGYECPHKWGHFAHPKDCSKYYECLRKVSSVRTCRRDMLFDNMKRKCMPMSGVQCGTRPNPYENISTTDTMTAKHLRTEPVETDTKHSRTMPGRVTTVKVRTKAEGNTSEVLHSKSEKATSKQPSIHSEKVSTEKANIKTERITSEVSHSKSEKVTLKQPSIHSERVSTEKENIKAERITSEVSHSKSEKATSKLPSIHSERVSTENANIKAERITSEVSHNKSKKVTSNTNSEGVSTEKANIKVERISSEVPKEKV